MSETKGAPWFPPTSEKPQLRVYNSLTQTVVPFAPKSGQAVKWYTCGPTVYDSAHLGHARAYVTFDIVRRLLSDYFGFDVFYVMNITDVDDKIILRARRNHLVAEYEKNATDINKVIADSKEAFGFAIADADNKVVTLTEKLKSVEKRHLADTEDQLQQSKLKRDILIKERTAFEAIAQSAPEQGSKALANVINAAKGVLAAKLDDTEGASSCDHSIFKAHTERYEQEFLEDMTALGVREVDALTRVTEYIDLIIAFVEKIIANGYAYESHGSVYFDTLAFMNSKDESGCCLHHYAKLKPTAVGNLQLAAEGEGALGSTGDKKHPNDFAVWKLSRPGEPRWESPWGLGRPGWHIECSAMATDLLGTNFDVHSGGDDLKFPHHDNEIAQSEAFSGNQQWVNYFFHAGHLNIAGLKMSKSLKNFVTIRQCLEFNTARQVRLLFLLQRWDGTMQYSDDSLKEAVAREQTLKQFFMNIQVLTRAQAHVATVSQFWNDQDRALQAAFEALQTQVHAALCDNLDYPAAMHLIFDMVNTVNKYLSASERDAVAPKMLLIKRISAYIERLMRIFGVIRDDEATFLQQYAQDGGSSEFAEKIIDTFTSFRDQIRDAARNPEASGLRGAVMGICDQVRDDDLPLLGIRLEDKVSGKAVWKMDDPAELLRQREEKKAAAKQKQINKLATGVKNLTKSVEKHTGALVAPADMFRGSELYSQFNEAGLPTHDADGNELSKNQAKQVQKAFNQREKDHADLKNQAAKAGVEAAAFVQGLQLELQAAQTQLAELNA